MKAAIKTALKLAQEDAESRLWVIEQVLDRLSGERLELLEAMLALHKEDGVEFHALFCHVLDETVLDVLEGIESAVAFLDNVLDDAEMWWIPDVGRNALYDQTLQHLGGKPDGPRYFTLSFAPAERGQQLSPEALKYRLAQCLADVREKA